MTIIYKWTQLLICVPVKLYLLATPLYTSSSEDGQSWLWAAEDDADVWVEAESMAEEDGGCSCTVTTSGTQVQMDSVGLKSHKPQYAAAAADAGHTALGRQFF